MTALSSTTAVFLKESKRCLYLCSQWNFWHGYKTAQDFPWTLALSSTGCNKNQLASAEYMLWCPVALRPFLSLSLFVFLPHGNQKTFLCSCFPIFPPQFLQIIFERLTAMYKQFFFFIMEYQNSEIPKGQTHRESKYIHIIFSKM